MPINTIVERRERDSEREMKETNSLERYSDKSNEWCEKPKTFYSTNKIKWQSTKRIGRRMANGERGKNARIKNNASMEVSVALHVLCVWTNNKRAQAHCIWAPSLTFVFVSLWGVCRLFSRKFDLFGYNFLHRNLSICEKFNSNSLQMRAKASVGLQLAISQKRIIDFAPALITTDDVIEVVQLH